MIILDARRIKAYEALREIGKQAGKDEEFLEQLWMLVCSDQDLFTELVYFLEHHDLRDEMKCCGYGLTDLYFYLMRRFEVRQDIGKNYADCDKDGLVLDTFELMGQMIQDPEPVIKHLEEGLGMDRMV